MRTKQPAFAAASALVLTILALSTPLFAADANHKPWLCGASISPKSGAARTVYVASVRYCDPDGDRPAKVEVYVDNIAYPMRLVKGKAESGYYRARITLPPGEHTYYFAAEDMRGMTERFPRYGMKPGPFVGTKQVYNRLPVLTGGGVFFDYGPVGATYTFTVHYSDKDGVKPRAVRVVVDGISHDMELHEGEANNGLYLYKTELPAGPHGYYFVGVDDCGACISHPQHGYLRGPTVDEVPNTNPVLVDGFVDPGIGGARTRFTYTVEYRDGENNAPAIARVYVNGVPHDMRHSCGKPANGLYKWSARRCLGEFHGYYFYFEDGRGGVCRLPETGTLHGPVVTK